MLEVSEHVVSPTRFPGEIRKQESGFGGRVAVARRKQAILCGLELLHPLLVAEVTRSAEPEEKLRVLLCIRVDESEGLPEVQLRLRQRIQGRGAIARIPQCRRAPVGKAAASLSGRTRQLESVEVVVRDHLGVVLGTAERLDPLGRAHDASRARSARGIWP